jgi:hypothetical protein
VETSAQHTPAERDGQHNFDFEIGTWKIHRKRLDHRLTGLLGYEDDARNAAIWPTRAKISYGHPTPAAGTSATKDHFQ